ncbi:MAG: AMP-binding protein, partial [Candidatus Zixiibacteriota bacterium]
MLVSQFLSESARRFADKTALVFDEKRYTYGELYEKAVNLASFLVRQGLRKGDRVGIYMGNSPETAISIFGTLEAGGCFIVINPTIKEEKLRHILENSGARFLITDNSKRALLVRTFSHLNSTPQTVFTGADDKQAARFEDIIQARIDLTRPKLIDVDLAAIIYTSGSTGDPKGVTMTHRNMVSAATSITTYLENREDDIILNMLPFSFDYGLYQLLMAFKIGGTLVLERTFGYPYQIIELIKREKITGLPFVPTIFAILLQLEHLGKENLESVRYITNTAAALPPAYIPKIKKAFPNARIYSMYGLTECKRVSYLPPDMIDKKPDSVGIAMPNTEVWIVDKKGNVLEPGQVGELVVRGGSVMQCYWNDPEGTAEVIKPGFFPGDRLLFTGDLFRMDKDGFLYFADRKDDVIKSRGERVSPKEIENTLYSMDEVLNARVIGVPHEIYGRAIKAEIVIKNGRSLSGAKVKAYCRRHMEDLMVPHI